MKNNLTTKNKLIITAALVPALITLNKSYAYTNEENTGINTMLNSFAYDNNTPSEHIEELGDEGIVEPIAFNTNYDNLSLSRASVIQKIVIVDNTSLLNDKSDNAGVIAKIEQGETVIVLSEEDSNWSKVIYNDYEGYIKNTNIGDLNNNSRSKSNNLIYINANSLNFRKGPSMKTELLASIKEKGASVTLLKENSYYHKVLYSKEGYLHKKYLKIDESNNSATTTGSVNFRSSSSSKSDSNIIGKLSKGQEVDVIAIEGNWVKVSYSKEGYLFNKFLTTKKPATNSNNSNSNVASSNNSNSSNNVTNNSSTKADKVVNYAKTLLGKPYVWGATGPNKFDCSGFTSYVFKNAIGKSLPRTSSQQGTVGTKISKSNMKKGDLITFTTNGKGTISHVGIYIGNNQFIHASSSSKKVVISNLSGYYSSRIVNIRRVI